MENRKISPVRVVILIIVAVAAIAGIGFGIKATFFNSAPKANIPQAAQPTTASAPGQAAQTQPGTNFAATAKPGTTGSNPAAPVATAAPVAGQPAQPATNGSYPVLNCKPGQPVLTVAFDAYAGFYPLIYRIMAMPGSDQYCINLMPKWYGPNGDQNGLEESQIETMLKSGKIDVYFATNGTLALYDANSALVVWTTDQSAGADKIIASNSVMAAGEKQPSFNDALGRSIMTSQGGADHFLALKMMQTVGFDPTMVNIVFPASGDPVGDYCAGKGDFVAYWDPAVSKALTCRPSTVLVSTSYWRTISDYVVISHNADTTKQNAVAYFLADYDTATAAFTKDNLAATAKVIVNFQFNGQDMASWMSLDKNDPVGSLTGLMNEVAIATLNDNVAMYEQDPTGSNLVKDQFVRAHNTWTFGGVTNNGNAGSLFDQNVLISDKYVKILENGGAKQVAGDFSNAYNINVSTTPPAVDTSTLITLPELLTLPYKNIKFVENQPDQLMPGEEQNLLNLVGPIASLMAESQDSTLVLQGGSGFYTTDPATLLSIKKFAFSRAQYIRKLLSDKLGIPIQRIVLDPNVIVPDHSLTNAELPQYMVVVISVVNSGQYK